MGGFSLTHWIIVLVVILVLAGTGRLKNIGKELGGAIKGFKDEVKKEASPQEKESSPQDS